MKSKLSIGLVVFLCFLLITIRAAWSQEVKFPTPSYEGEELAKVREWEKTWAGKKVTSANIDQVKDLLLGPLYTILKNSKDFGADDFSFEFRYAGQHGEHRSAIRGAEIHLILDRTQLDAALIKLVDDIQEVSGTSPQP